MSVIGTALGGVYDSDERGQLEVVEAGDVLGEGGGAAASEEAVDVAFLGDIDHRVDRIGEQRRVLAHLRTLAGRGIEHADDFGDRLFVGSAADAQQVEEVLGFGVVRDDLALVVEVDEVVRVEPVASAAVLACELIRVRGEVPKREDDAGVR